jgi:transcriptional regulator with XRE-family HTH domain
MLSDVKTDEQNRARELRAQGHSVKEIERSLGVSRSSVSRWVRDVPLGPEQRRALAARVREGPLVAGERKAAAARAACKLVVHRTRIVQTIFGSIQEYGGFERPEWLD